MNFTNKSMLSELMNSQYRDIWLQYIFRDQLKFIAENFDPGDETTFDIRAQTADVRCNLKRHDNRMVLYVYALGGDNDYMIFNTVLEYAATARSNEYSPQIRRYLDESLSHTVYARNLNEIYIHEATGFRDFKTCTLAVPLQEEQIFQQLTRLNVPPQEVLQFFLDTGEYIMKGVEQFLGFSFHAGFITNQINETNTENMVQSVQNVLDRLLIEELSRKQDDGYLDVDL